MDGLQFSSVQFYFETNRQTAVSKQKRMNEWLFYVETAVQRAGGQ